MRGGNPRRTSAPRRKRGDGLAAFGFLFPNIAGFSVFTLIPLAASLVMSFYHWSLIGEIEFAGLANFARLISDPGFHRALLNTVVFVVLYMVGNLVLSLGLALWLSTKVRGKALLRVVFFLPVVSPMVANAVVWRLLYAPNGGVIDYLIGVVTGVENINLLGNSELAMLAMVIMSVWQGFGYNMIIFVAGIQAIPTSIIEASLLDGATPWRRMLNITLPSISPSIFFATVMTLMSSFQVFAQPYIMTGGGPGTATTTLVLYLYRAGFVDYQMGYAATIAWTLFLLIMTLTVVQFVLQRRWVHYE